MAKNQKEKTFTGAGWVDPEEKGFDFDAHIFNGHRWVHESEPEYEALAKARTEDGKQNNSRR